MSCIHLLTIQAAGSHPKFESLLQLGIGLPANVFAGCFLGDALGSVRQLAFRLGFGAQVGWVRLPCHAPLNPTLLLAEWQHEAMIV
jgi:hypothetical protein